MGRKNKNKKSKTEQQASAAVPPQLANLPPELKAQYMASMGQLPTKEEIERRSKLFFAPAKHPNYQISKAELAQLHEWFGENWWADLVSQVRGCYTFE